MSSGGATLLSSAWTSQIRIVFDDVRLATFIQCQLCFDHISQADIEITTIGKYEVNLRTTIPALVDRDLAHDFAFELFLLNHDFSNSQLITSELIAILIFLRDWPYFNEGMKAKQECNILSL